MHLELDAFGSREVDEYLSKYYSRKQSLNEEQKKKIFDLASLGSEEVLPLKIKLVVKYLNENTVKSINDLLNEANIIKR